MSLDSGIAHQSRLTSLLEPTATLLKLVAKALDPDWIQTHLFCKRSGPRCT